MVPFMTTEAPPKKRTRNPQVATTNGAATKLAPGKRGPKSPMTKEHKAKLAAGRTEALAVRAYLEYLRDATPARRGRRRTPESIDRRIDAIVTDLANDPPPITELHLRQELMNLEAERAETTRHDGREELMSSFIAVAANYGERNGISYSTWRKVGVPANVLRAAGIR